MGAEPAPWAGFAQIAPKPAAAPRRTRRWPYLLAVGVLSAAVLALAAGYAYSTDSAERWRTQDSKDSASLATMTAQRDSLSAKAATLGSQLSDANSRLSDTTTQLNSANDRIRTLANDKAQLGDNAALQAQAEAQLAQLVGASQKVSSDLTACIGSLQNLQHYLVNSTAYDQASLLAYAQGINSQCDNARSESDALTKTIQGLGK